MANFQGAPLEEQIKKLLEQNLAYSKQIYVMTKKIKRYMMISKIMSIVYILIIIVPILFSIFYLPDLLKKFTSQILPAGLSSQAGLDGVLGDDVNQNDLINSVKQQGGALNAYKNILDLYSQ